MMLTNEWPMSGQITIITRPCFLFKWVLGHYVAQWLDGRMHGGMKELYPLTSKYNISNPNRNHH